MSICSRQIVKRFQKEKVKEKKSKVKEIKRKNKRVLQLKQQPCFRQILLKCSVSTHLIHSCLEGFPGARVPATDEERSQWCVHIEKMLRIDHRTEEQIGLHWSMQLQTSSGKRTSVVHKKFREKFETLYMQSQAGKDRGKGNR